MAFDETKFRELARAAKISDEEIESTVKSQLAVAAAPSGAAVPPVSEEFSTAQAKAKADYDAKVKKMLTTNITVGNETYEIPSFFTSPAGIVTAIGAGIGLGTTIYGAGVVAPKAYNAIKNRWVSKAPAIDRTVDIPLEGPTPTFDAKTVAPAAMYSAEDQALMDASERNRIAKAAAAAAKQGKPIIEAPITGMLPSGSPAAPVTPADLASKLSSQIGQFDPANIGQPLQDPLSGRGYQYPIQDIGPRQPVPPSISETLANGGNVNDALKENLAVDLDKANLAQQTKTTEPAVPPQGMKEQYKKNKTNPIGPGGYNYFASQVGSETAPTRWLEQYGEKNVPHAQVQRDYSDTRYPPKPNPTGAKTGGAFGTPKYIPEYIKGGASIGGMAGAAAIPALVAAGVQAYKGNKEAVNAELKDAWNSMKSLVTMPVDVAKAAGKGDFGPFKDMLMSMNPGTLLMNEMNKRDESAIQGMIQAEKVGAGRGIAPPSAYFR
jgi:hypothetical protein